MVIELTRLMGRLTAAQILCLLLFSPALRAQNQGTMGEELYVGPYASTTLFVAHDVRRELLVSVQRNGGWESTYSIIRSIDSGRTWRSTELDPALFSNEETQIESLVVGPGHIAWIATSTGELLVSRDDAVTWSLAAHIDPPVWGGWIIAANDRHVIRRSTIGEASEPDPGQKILAWSEETQRWTPHYLPRSGNVVWMDTLLLMQVYDAPTKRYRMARTPDLGATREVVDLGEPFLRGIPDEEFSVWNDELVVFGNRDAWRSSDFGASWSLIDIDVPGEEQVQWYATDGVYLYGRGEDRLFRFGDAGIDAFPALEAEKEIAKPFTVGERLMAPGPHGILEQSDRGETGWVQTGGETRILLVAGEDRLWGYSSSGYLFREVDGTMKFELRGLRGAVGSGGTLHPIPGTDSLVGRDGRNLRISSDGGDTWGEAYEMKEAIIPSGLSTELWATSDALYATNYIPHALPSLFRSHDRGHTWEKVAVDITPGYRHIFFPGPVSDPQSIYLIRHSVTGDHLTLSISHDGGTSWEERGEMGFDITTLDVPDKLLPQSWLTRGSDHLIFQIDRSRWALLSSDGVDTVVWDDPTLNISGMTLHNGFLIGLVNNEDVRIDRPNPYPARFIWRRRGDERWREYDARSPDDPRIPGGGYFLNSSVFQSTSNALYVVTPMGGVWRLGEPSGETRGRYQLTVEGGYGSGRYDAGDTVHLTAHPLEANHAFGAWGIDQPDPVDNIGYPREWRAYIVMPSHDLRILTREDTLDMPYREERLVPVSEGESVEISLAVAQGEPKGIIVLLAEAWKSHIDVMNGVEVDHFVRDAVVRGYHVASVSSSAHLLSGGQGLPDTLRWDTDFSNSRLNYDIVRVERTIDWLRQEYGAELPVYPVAIDNAGMFATLLARKHRSPAIGYVGSSAPRSAYRYLTSPAALLEVEHYGAEAAGMTSVSDFNGLHRWNGFETLYLRFGGRELDWKTFMRIEGTDSVTSSGIVRELAFNNWLHPRGLTSANAIRNGRATFDSIAQRSDSPTLGRLTDLQRDRVWELILVSNAYAGFFSEYNEALLDFFEDHTEPALPSGVEENIESSDESDLNLTFQPASSLLPTRR